MDREPLADRRDEGAGTAAGFYEPLPGTGPFLSAYAQGRYDGAAEYVIPNLAPGTYGLGGTGGEVPVLPKHVEKIVVKPGETTDVTVTLSRLAKTTGRLVEANTGKPIPAPTCRFVQPVEAADFPNNVGSGFVKTDADGRYTAYVPPGFTYSVSVYAPPSGYVKPEYQRGRLPVPDAKVEAAGHVFPEIKLRKSTAFTATVVDAAGKPVAATVYPGRVHRRLVADRFRGRRPIHFPRAGPGRHDRSAGAAGERRQRPSGGGGGRPRDRRRRGGGERLPPRRPRHRPAREAGRGGERRGALALPGRREGVVVRHRRVLDDALTTDAEGRYKSSALWPTDRYNVSVTAPGFGKGESEQVLGVAGKTHEIADVRLERANLAVRGVVVDLDGKPVAGATVFNRGDGEKEMRDDRRRGGPLRAWPGSAPARRSCSPARTATGSPSPRPSRAASR